MAFGSALVVQALALYWPRVATTGGLQGGDKVAHVLLFGAPALVGVLARVPTPIVGGVLLAHAVLSEMIQGALLPNRGAELADAGADVVGVALGLAVGRLLARRQRMRSGQDRRRG